MNTRIHWSPILVIVGGFAMLIGALDPLEGSIFILIGSALVVSGTYLSNSQRIMRLYWVWAFILITFGIAMMWTLTALGGIGGSTGRSGWWGLIILPYPIGWIMGMVSLIVRLVKFIKARKLRK